MSRGFKASQTITNNSSGAMKPSKFATWFENKMDDAGKKSMQVGQDYNEESAAEGNMTNTEEATEGKDGSLKIVAVTEKPEDGLTTKGGEREETQGEYSFIRSLSKIDSLFWSSASICEVVLSGPNQL